MEYDNFLLKLYKSAAGDSRYQAQVLVPDAAGGGRFDLPMSPEELEELRDQSVALRGYAEFGETFRHGLGYVPVHEVVRSLTQQLYDSLPDSLQDQIGACLARAMGRGRGLRIGVLVDPTAGELAGLPWEMLWHPDWSGGYLAQSPAAPIMRLVTTSFPTRRWPRDQAQAIRSNGGNRFTLGISPAAPPRSALVALVGAVEELQVAGAFDEAKLICDALAPQTVVDIVPPPLSLGDLEAALSSHNYQVLHIITHGYADKSLGLAHLLFDQPDQARGSGEVEADNVTGSRLLSVLQGQDELELIVLSSCRSAAALRPTNLDAPVAATPPSTNGGFLTSSIGALVAAGTGLPVLAMQFDILAPAEVIEADPTRSWALAFYKGLSRGQGVERALTAARRALNVDKDPVLWAAPSLFVPLYWIEPPPPLYERIDARFIRGMAASMEENGQVLLEGMLIAGLLLVAGLAMTGLLAAPGDSAAGPALSRAALSLFATLSVLPAAITGCVMVLAARRQPLLRMIRGRLALSILLTAYAGAGLGILTVLGVLGILALVLHYLGQAYPLLSALAGPLIQGAAVIGCVLQGMVSAGRFVSVAQSVADAPQIYNLGPVIGWSPLILGALLALTMQQWYGLLLSGPGIIFLVGVALIAYPLWLLRQPPEPRG